MTIDIVEEMRIFEIDHDPDGWPAVKMRQISALCDEIERLRADAARLDWLADPRNAIGNVQLPTHCVTAHPDSLRDAIDMAMTDEARNDVRSNAELMGAEPIGEASRSNVVLERG